MGHAGLSHDYRPHEDQAKLDPGGAVGGARRSHIPERDALSQYIVHVVSLVWVILRGANVIGTSSGHRISLSAGPNFFQTYSFELSHKCVYSSSRHSCKILQESRLLAACEAKHVLHVGGKAKRLARSSLIVAILQSTWLDGDEYQEACSSGL